MLRARHRSDDLFAGFIPRGGAGRPLTACEHWPRPDLLAWSRSRLTTAVHVHGGVGIDLSHPAHRYFVAAKHCEFMLGGATVLLRRLGAKLAGAGR